MFANQGPLNKNVHCVFSRISVLAIIMDTMNVKKKVWQHTSDWEVLWDSIVIAETISKNQEANDCQEDVQKPN
ncbi:hypothetical protein CUMW_268470 [Citrus unshiu]|uniref:Uncharacterized protein n=1 Tax=Citrus unshiu TaxID=55188 RepID=A0A2H5QWI9_CITUN|nr:hypothetical protein CUMW_268470 [Citrus unshiu]